jgi:hypothetical protein
MRRKKLGPRFHVSRLALAPWPGMREAQRRISGEILKRLGMSMRNMN